MILICRWTFYIGQAAKVVLTWPRDVVDSLSKCNTWLSKMRFFRQKDIMSRKNMSTKIVIKDFLLINLVELRGREYWSCQHPLYANQSFPRRFVWPLIFLIEPNQHSCTNLQMYCNQVPQIVLGWNNKKSDLQHLLTILKRVVFAAQCIHSGWLIPLYGHINLELPCHIVISNVMSNVS